MNKNSKKQWGPLPQPTVPGKPRSTTPPHCFFLPPRMPYIAADPFRRVRKLSVPDVSATSSGYSSMQQARSTGPLRNIRRRSLADVHEVAEALGVGGVTVREVMIEPQTARDYPTAEQRTYPNSNPKPTAVKSSFRRRGSLPGAAHELMNINIQAGEPYSYPYPCLRTP